MELAGVPVVVAGGASGMGEATVRRFAARGALVTIIDRDAERAGALAAEVGGRAVAGDVASGPDMEAAFTGLAEAGASPRVLVQCAGIGAFRQVVGRSSPHDLELFERVVRVNLVGTFNCVRLAAWAMSRLAPLADGERGVIVTTSSIAAFDGVDGGVAYSASKGGVAAMALPLARDLGGWGIRVVDVAPGSVDTPLVKGVPEAYRQAMEAATPFPGRFAEPAEFAALADHIVANRFLNGCTIRIDGAQRMAPSRPFRS